MNELLIHHRTSPYASLYRIQPRLVTNWAAMLFLQFLIPAFGSKHAEQGLATLYMLAGYGCLFYFRRSIQRQGQVCDPGTNFLLHTWFLWVGFYNFYLGMAICVLIVGFYVRHHAQLELKSAIAVAMGLVLLFFTHVLPLVIAVMAIAAVASWATVVLPFLSSSRPPLDIVIREARRHLAVLSIMLMPACTLLFFFVRRSIQHLNYDPQLLSSWNSFPMHVFATARGRIGEEVFLYPAILFYIITALFVMKRREWLTPVPAIAIVAVLSFCAYLLAPDNAFGGGEIKIRLAWIVFFLGYPIAASTSRLRPLQTALSIYISPFLVASLLITSHNLNRVSEALDVYASALEQIPPGATVVRLRYPTNQARLLFGFDEFASEPLFHSDAWVAARQHWIDLSDYQALCRLFPLTYRRGVLSGELQITLYELETGETHGYGPLIQILQKAPIPIDYVVLIGDQGPNNSNGSFGSALEWLNAHMKLIDQGNSFVRVYRRHHR